MVLTKEDLDFLLNEQRKLDETIMNNSNRSLEDTFELRKIAFLVELNEFINDLQFFKYWKKNNAPKETATEEFVDALHFALSLATTKLTNEEIIQEVENSLEKCSQSIHDVPTKEEKLNRLITTMYALPVNEKESIYTAYLVHLLVLADTLDMKREGILNAYDEKNKVNYKRQEEGY